MSFFAISLVLVSAALHALWNFLLKRAGAGQQVVALSKVAEVVLFAPVFLVFSSTSLPSTGITLRLTGFAAVGVIANYVALAEAYRHGDLSFVYPIARGAVLVFLPVIGYVTLGERLSLIGSLALILIVTGIASLNLSGVSREAFRSFAAALNGRATVYALIAALITAGYSVWDKYAVSQMQPFAYMYLYTVLVALAYAAWLSTRFTTLEIKTSWAAHWPSVMAIGVLNSVSYLLVLAALRTDMTSYVLGMRQLSIAVGVGLGWKLLREPMNRMRVTGIALIVAGCLLIAMASNGSR